MKTTDEEITGETTINAAARTWPATMAVFHRFGLDSCCGGALPIQVAAERHGLDLGAVLRALNAARR